MSQASPISKLSAEFQSAETEHRFSRRFISQQQQLISTACRIGAVIYLIALLPDYLVFGFSDELVLLAATRVVLATGFLVLSFVIVRDTNNYYRNVFALQILMGLCVASTQAIKNGADSQQIVTVLFIFCIYLLAANRLILSTIAGCLFATFNVLSITFLQPDVDLTLRHILMLITANIFGFLIWYQFNIIQRREFLSQELTDNRQLELDEEIERRHLVEQDLRKALDVATKVDASKSKMIATVSHDLRSPLNAIIGFADISVVETEDLLAALEQRQASDDERQLVIDITDSLIHISKSGRHLADVIDNLLATTKLEFNDSEIFEVETSIDNLLEVPRTVAQQLADQAKVNVFIYSEEAPRYLWIDVGRVRQILINLLGNAIKFTPEGGDVSLTVFLNEVGDIAFEIADTGIGISPDDIDYIFNPFTHKQGGGLHGEASTGLGLPLSRNLAEHHGGRIDLKSTLGKGTVFTLVLPADRIRMAPTIT
jgi:signal transduction histidine kinase